MHRTLSAALTMIAAHAIATPATAATIDYTISGMTQIEYQVYRPITIYASADTDLIAKDPTLVALGSVSIDFLGNFYRVTDQSYIRKFGETIYLGFDRTLDNGLSLGGPEYATYDLATPRAASPITTFWALGDPNTTQGMIRFIGLTNGVFSAAPGVPEPSTWAMMILGFGMIGYSFRKRQAVRTAVRFV